VEYAASTTGTWDADAAAANTIYGPSGAPISGALTLYRFKVVRFQTPIQTGDKIEVELSDDGVYWFPANGATYKNKAVLPSMNSGGYAWSGVNVKKTAGNSTDVTVTFGQFVNIANDDSPTGDWGEGGYWRVRKTSAGAAVGFGIVNPGVSAGLVSANGLPGRTDGVAVGAGYVGEEAELATGVATCNGVSDTLVVTKTLDVGTWLVIASTNAAVSNAQTGHKSTIGIKGTVGSVSGYDTCTFDAKTNNSWGTINFPNRVVTIASDDADKTIKLYDVAIGADQSYSCRGNISAIRIA
jgi:hypothetical protein